MVIGKEFPRDSNSTVWVVGICTGSAMNYADHSKGLATSWSRSGDEE